MSDEMRPQPFDVVLRWILKDPGMVRFFLRVLRSNTSAEAEKLKSEQRAREAFMKKTIEDYFRGTEFDESETLYKEIGGAIR